MDASFCFEDQIQKLAPWALLHLRYQSSSTTILRLV